jgi:uncharacterized membrane protein
MNYSPQLTPFFSLPLRWTLRVLAWLAFLVAGYLAWHSIGGTSVAACGVGDANSCDIVLNSSWGKWLGIPVAVFGLACYATLAALSVVLGIQNSQVIRWINTAFVMLALLTAGASLWFIGVQLLAIGSICPFCMVTDVCGAAIGGVTIWVLVQRFVFNETARNAHNSAVGLAALRTALPPSGTGRTAPPAAARSVPLVATRGAPAVTLGDAATSPSVPIACGGAAALLIVLVTGQLVFPSKTFISQKSTLEQPMSLDGSDSEQPAETVADSSSTAESHVALRIPSEPVTGSGPVEGERDKAPPGQHEDQVGDNNLFESETSEAASAAPNEASATNHLPANGNTATQPRRSSGERIVEFLNGTLKLDVYKHALIGSPEAPHVMIEMVSYNCPHCREMHRMVEHGLARYGSQMAIIIMPIPLEMRCNRLVTDPKASHAGACSTARMALGIASIQPQSFKRFHDWLMADKEKPPREDKVFVQAYTMVDRTRLRALSNGPELTGQIKQYVELYARLASQARGNKNFGLPVQVLGNHIMAGKTERESDLFEAWEKHLGVTGR